MNKALKIIRINILALVAIPLLLLATAAKLIAKALEKIPLLFSLFFASVAVLSLASFGKSAQTLLRVILTFIAIAIVFSLLVVIVMWIFSMISNFAVMLWNMLISCFDSLYNLTYLGYQSLLSVCESDYQFISLNGRKKANLFICLFYTILKGLSWLIITLISFALPLSAAGSVALVLGTLIDLNSNVKKSFGLNLIQFARMLPVSSVVLGVIVYLLLMAILITALLTFGAEWYEWAQDLKMTAPQIAEDITDLQSSNIQMASGSPTEVEAHLAYLHTIEEHVQGLEPLGQQVQDILSKKDNPLLRSTWGTYMHNLQALVDECSAKSGVTVEQLKRLVPQIEQLDKQRGDVQKTIEKLTSQLQNPAESTVFFMGCDTEEKLEKRYKALCKTYHPDETGGDTETFQKMKEEYESLKALYPTQD